MPSVLRTVLSALQGLVVGGAVNMGLIMVRALLLRQFETAWSLTSFHLNGLTTEECLWRPSHKGLHVHQTPNGVWCADWPDRESYDVGPPSIAWLTWHISFWWSMVLNHSFVDMSLTREEISWAGSGEQVRETIQRLRCQWREALEGLTDEDLTSAHRTRWPFRNRPFADVVAWVNVELTKNAAEVGFARFLYAAGDCTIRQPQV